MARTASLTFASWNQLGEWLRRLDVVRRAAESVLDGATDSPSGYGSY